MMNEISHKNLWNTKTKAETKIALTKYTTTSLEAVMILRACVEMNTKIKGEQIEANDEKGVCARWATIL